MRDQELIQALREHAECQKAFEDLGGESGIYADAYNDLAENFYGIPAAKVVSLHDIYRVIAEGKKVNPVRPSDVAPMVHGRWISFHSEAAGDIQYCSACEIGFDAKTDYCPHCWAKMDGGAGNG